MKKIKIENIKRRSTKLLPELKHKSYTERLQSLGLPSLEYRRLRADMIQTYEIFKNIDRIERIKNFKQYHTNVSTTRGHNFKIFKPHCKTNLRKNTDNSPLADHYRKGWS